MSVALQIDRHFLFLHSENLAVFTERVLRNTVQNPNLSRPEEIWEKTKSACEDLRVVLKNPYLKRKDRTEAVRAKEAVLLLALEKFAEYVEKNAKFKSDALSTGFHLHAEQANRDTRRKQRMSVKMARLSLIEAPTD